MRHRTLPRPRRGRGELFTNGPYLVSGYEPALAVFAEDAIRVRADLALGEAYAVAFERAQDFARFDFNFVFFAADERDDVAEHINRGMPGIARARQRLHRRYYHALYAKRSIKRSERHHKSNGRAVGISHNRALPPAPLALSLYQPQMLVIYLWHEQRHIIVHAMIL